MQGIRKLTSGCLLNDVFGHYQFLHVPTSKVEPIWMLNSSAKPLFTRRHIRGRLYGCSTHLDISTLQLLFKNFRNNLASLSSSLTFSLFIKKRKNIIKMSKETHEKQLSRQITAQKSRLYLGSKNFLSNLWLSLEKESNDHKHFDPNL